MSGNGRKSAGRRAKSVRSAGQQFMAKCVRLFVWQPAWEVEVAVVVVVPGHKHLCTYQFVSGRVGNQLFKRKT